MKCQHIQQQAQVLEKWPKKREKPWSNFAIQDKGCAFTDFKDLIELEKLHPVQFQSGSYENESGCKDFIKSIAEYFFKQEMYSKLVRVNFIAILCNETTGTSLTEQEVVYIFL